MATNEFIDAATLPYDDLCGEYIWREPNDAFRETSGVLCRIDDSGRAYAIDRFTNKWRFYSDFLGNISGMTGDYHKFWVVSEEFARQRVREWGIDEKDLFVKGFTSM